MKTILLIISAFFALNNISFAQLQGQAKIDSLLKELPKAKQDTNAVNLYAKLSFNFFTTNPNKGIEYGEKGLEIAQKIGWKIGEADCCNSLGINNAVLSQYPKALEYFYKALKISKELRDKRGEAASIGNIANIYRSQFDNSKAIEYFNKALQINEELGDKSGVAGNLGNIGNIYASQSDYPKALEYYYQVIKIEEELGNKSSMANALNNIGTIYESQSDYPKALDSYHKSLKIYEELEDKSGVATVFGNIGIVYSMLEDTVKTLEYFHKALKINKELGDKSDIARNLGNIGSVYMTQENYSKALEYLYNALEINEELGRKSGIAYNLGDIGSIYKKQSDYPRALEFYHKALKIREELGDKSGIANNLGNIGQLYYNLSQDSVAIKPSELNQYLSLNKDINLNNSIDYLLSSIEIFKEIGELEPSSTVYKFLSDSYSKKGDYQKAYESYVEYKTLQDSVFNMDKAKDIANLEAKRENELKDAEIVILQTQKKAQQFQSYLLGGGVIVLFGAFGIAFLRFREKKKLSDKLSIQNIEIENQKSIVEEKNEQIVASITYASTIQHAILPWKSTLKNAFGDILIFYKPKDIVSGDSYWFKEVDGVKFLAAIDCTGHGIPGAMLTVIASSVLDDAVLSKRLSDTAEILTYMNEKVTDVLNQRLTENQTRDGMEVALISINNDRIQFSGAGRPLYLKNGTIEIIKTDKRGIAGSAKNDEYNFTSIEINKADNMTLYLTTDGFPDQMNENSKKYSTKRFVALLYSISDKPILEQQKILENEFNSHKGNREQIDDITILGVKI